MAKKSRSNRSAEPANDMDTDIGTPELHRRLPTQVFGTGKDRRAKVINNPLDEYLARELISDEQHFAGRQYFSLWYRAGHAPRFQAMNLLLIPGGTGDGESLMGMREKYHTATNAFRGAQERQTVFGVVCLGEYAFAALGVTSRSPGGRKAVANLRMGLDDLVHHFSRQKSKTEYKGSIRD